MISLKAFPCLSAGSFSLNADKQGDNEGWKKVRLNKRIEQSGNKEAIGLLTGFYFLTFLFFCTAYLSFTVGLYQLTKIFRCFYFDSTTVSGNSDAGSNGTWIVEIWVPVYFLNKSIADIFITSAILFNRVKVKSVSPYSILQYALVDKLSFSPICSCVRFFPYGAIAAVVLLFSSSQSPWS